MKKATTILVFLCIQLSFSQLSVRNNAYIFATDEVVFVEDDVNLNEANSKLYLRNDAQLIQGTGTTGNSGVGELSVQQTGTTDNFEYNYWCSPVGHGTGLLGNESSLIYQVITDPTGLITANAPGFTSGLNGTSSPLIISDYWLYTFVTSSNYSQWSYVGPSNPIAPGLGFTMKGTVGGGQVYDYRGKPNSGTITNNIANGQFTLIGNPYPSALDAFDFIHDTSNATNITGTLYFWDQNDAVNSHNLNAYQGGYATYTIDASATVETFIDATFDTYNSNGTLNTTGGGSTNGKIGKRYIQIAQGFMVEGSAAGTVRTTNAMRDFVKSTDATMSSFFRNSNQESTTNNSNTENETIISYSENGLAIVPEDYKRFRLNVDFNETYTRQLVQTFHNTATDGFDYGLESKSPSEIASGDASWILNADRYSAQANTFDVGNTIPLIVKIGQQQMIRVRIFDVQNFDASQPIFLHDIDNDLYVDLRNQDFTANIDAGNYTDRFEITFTDASTLNSDEFTAESLTIFQNNQIKQLVIKNPDLLQISNVIVYDVSGKRVTTISNPGNESEITVSTENLSDAMYVVEVATKDSKIINKKIVISN